MKNYALIENDIVTNIVIAEKTHPDLQIGIWVEAETMSIGDNYVDYLRQKSYAKEADPLYFKWQRGESTEQVWLDKINEIKVMYPRTVV